MWWAGGGVQADEIIALGVLPRFVEFLQCHDDPILQVHTLWRDTKH